MSKCHHIAVNAVLISAVSLLMTTQSTAAPDDARQIFDDLYKKRIDAVRKTLSRADDLKLAAELLSVSKQDGIDANLQELLCNNAYELGMRSKAGYATAIDAMRLLAALPGAKGRDASSKLLDAMNRQYLSASGDERITLGEAMVDQYIETGDAYVKVGNPDEAVKLYRKAALAAGRIRSPKIADAKARIEWAVARQRAQRNAERLEQALLRDATDTASAKALVLIYLTELDRPVDAARYASRAGDDELKAMTLLAAKPLVQLSHAEQLKLGVWFNSLASEVPMQARDVPLQKAKEYLSTFIESGRGSGFELTKAKLLLSDTEKALASRHADRPKMVRTTRRGSYVDLNDAKAAFGLGDRWSIQHEVLSGYWGNIDDRKPQTTIPIKAKTLRYGFKVKSKWYQMAFVKLIDRGSAHMGISRGHWDNSATYIFAAGKIHRLGGKVTTPDDWHQIEIKIDARAITFIYDGAEVHQYQFIKHLRDAERFTLGFATHAAAMQIKDMYLIIDGRPAKRLPTPK